MSSIPLGVEIFASWLTGKQAQALLNVPDATTNEAGAIGLCSRCS
jgi:hypothetical protein